ncbi:metal-dependent hydrolase [Halobacterium yunchengense]|uniref:metal-dependent hydrolase n=1 Tax=Halobacterium yunchengense TaxID=3108497 RepID=UPI00300AC83F
MWPWGHLGLGYLLALPVLGQYDVDDEYVALAVLALGTQLPDVVDKPLAWTFGVMPYGRAMMHSLVVFAAAAVVLTVLSVRVRVRVPLLVGWASHIAGDVLYPLAEGAVGDVTFLAWPLLALPEPAGDYGLLSYFRHLALTGETALEVSLFVLAGVVFLVRERRSTQRSVLSVENAD